MKHNVMDGRRQKETERKDTPENSHWNEGPRDIALWEILMMFYTFSFFLRAKFFLKRQAFYFLSFRSVAEEERKRNGASLTWFTVADFCGILKHNILIF